LGVGENRVKEYYPVYDGRGLEIAAGAGRVGGPGAAQPMTGWAILLLHLDGDLDLSIGEHYDQQQEEEMVQHRCLPWVKPAGEVQPAYSFSG
jgi:hypothetical protein